MRSDFPERAGKCFEGARLAHNGHKGQWATGHLFYLADRIWLALQTMIKRRPVNTVNPIRDGASIVERRGRLGGKREAVFKNMETIHNFINYNWVFYYLVYPSAENDI